jgi:hypothetical protein
MGHMAYAVFIVVGFVVEGGQSVAKQSAAKWVIVSRRRRLNLSFIPDL